MKKRHFKSFQYLFAHINQNNSFNQSLHVSVCLQLQMDYVNSNVYIYVDIFMKHKNIINTYVWTLVSWKYHIHLNSHDPYVFEDKQIHKMVYFGKRVRNVSFQSLFHICDNLVTNLKRMPVYIYYVVYVYRHSLWTNLIHGDTHLIE